MTTKVVASQDLLGKALETLNRRPGSTDTDLATAQLLVLMELVKEVRVLNDHMAGISNYLSTISKSGLS